LKHTPNTIYVNHQQQTIRGKILEPTKDEWNDFEKTSLDLRKMFLKMRCKSESELDAIRKKCYGLLEGSDRKHHPRHLEGWKAEIDYIWCVLTENKNSFIQPTTDGRGSLGDFSNPDQPKGFYIDTTTNLSKKKINAACKDSKYKCYAVRKKGVDWSSNPCSFVIIDCVEIKDLIDLAKEVKNFIKNFGTIWNPVNLSIAEIRKGLDDSNKLISDIHSRKYNVKIPGMIGVVPGAIKRLENKIANLERRLEEQIMQLKLERAQIIAGIKNSFLQINNLIGTELDSDWKMEQDIFEILEDITPIYLRLQHLIIRSKDLENLPDEIDDEEIDDLVYNFESYTDLNGIVEEYLIGEMQRMYPWSDNGPELVSNYNRDVLDLEQYELLFFQEDNKEVLGESGIIIHEFIVWRCEVLISEGEVVSQSEWTKGETLDFEGNIHWDDSDEIMNSNSLFEEENHPLQEPVVGPWNRLFRMTFEKTNSITCQVAVIGYVLWHETQFGDWRELSDYYSNPHYGDWNIEPPDVH
jgi:hypothetical protein